MTYSYTQVAQYLGCPRRYRHRYLDGWKEKDTRAAILFGRAFEQALSAYFRRDDSGAVLFRECAAHKNSPLEYANGATWDHMLEQGIQLLECFAQDDRVRIRQPRKNLQIKFTRSLPKGNDFVARPPIQTHCDSCYTLRGVLDHGDLAAVGADQPRGCNSKPLIGIQPLVIVQRPVFHGVFRQALHGFGARFGKGCNGRVVQVDQVVGDREPVPELPPERRSYFVETH